MIANVLLSNTNLPMVLSKRTVFLWFPRLSRLISSEEVQKKEKNQSKIDKKNIRPEPRRPEKRGSKDRAEARAPNITNTLYNN